MYDFKCPYCGEEIKFDYPIESENFDYECPKCEEEFEVTVEWSPDFSVSKIQYVVCPDCGREHRDVATRGPKPEKYKNMDSDDYAHICERCFHRELYCDMESEG